MRIYLVLGLMLCAVTALDAALDKVVCYYDSSATYRINNGKFDTEDINPSLCTHIIYAFVGLDPLKDSDMNVTRFTNLKIRNPKVKLMLAVGGWNAESEFLSSMASTISSRTTFITLVVNFLTTHGLNGLDIYWEYPTMRGGEVDDRVNFVKLLSEIKSRFSSNGLLLSIAVGATRDFHRASYNVPEINKYVDFVNLRSYDLHGHWDAHTGHNAPLYGASWENDYTTSMYNVDACVRGWLSSGLTSSKLVVGIPIYGRTFTLASNSANAVDSRTLRYGDPGIYTQKDGMLSYLEVCERLKTGYTKVWDNMQKVPYAFKGNQWISFDDTTSVSLKVDYARYRNLGGVMLWSIDYDDDRNVCGGGTYPITRAAYTAVFGSSGTTLPSATPTATTPKTTATTSKTTTTTAKPTTTTSKATTTTPKTTTTTPRTTSTTAKTTTTTKPTTTTPRPVTTTPAGGSMMCPSTGFKRDPNDCSAFYQCTPGWQVNLTWRITCQSGLYFDETTNTCNWSFLVKC
ncbi:chitinase-3-like protein 1 isoform X1 [Toxorhynchites rutilus septentrionalis]|uniref:chitinase-3-like protein 1 isoform X1 n=1 Tax=Toxorhynchites rutilus septentrionalis TaxID=329112 RepID=UPI002479E285|nr:chitinase-3-like protein 1 isoform X1 [Toxorhynchites rutilus septentrionalis]